MTTTKALNTVVQELAKKKIPTLLVVDGVDPNFFMQPTQNVYIDNKLVFSSNHPAQIEAFLFGLMTGHKYGSK
jgi:hypothetical protein